MSQTVREIAEKIQAQWWDGWDVSDLSDSDVAGIRQLAVHVLASTEPLGDERLTYIENCLVDQNGDYTVMLGTGKALTLLAEIRRLQAELNKHATRMAVAQRLEREAADLRTQLQAAQQLATGYRGEWVTMLSEFHKQEQQIQALQKLADERGREVERLRDEWAESGQKWWNNTTNKRSR